MLHVYFTRKHTFVIPTTFFSTVSKQMIGWKHKEEFILDKSCWRGIYTRLSFPTMLFLFTLKNQKFNIISAWNLDWTTLFLLKPTKAIACVTLFVT